MRELRLIGVHDDGDHLVATDDAGTEFRLRIDDRLRASVRRKPRTEQSDIAPEHVGPKDVQAMIRAGSTGDEVAARTGWDPAKVARFEGPVLAEREHVAARAQTVRMRGTSQSGAPETLTQRAAARLATRDVDADAVTWDAVRDHEGQWTVSAIFVAGGRERAATWWFDQAGMSVVAKNDEAKWLSEADGPGGSGPVPGTVHRPTDVFDVEVEEERAERASRPEPDDLITSMREHSGAKQRGRGGRRRTRAAAPAPVEESLPFDTGETPPAARGTHPRDEAEDAGTTRPAAEETAPADDEDESPTMEMPVTRPDAAADEAKGARAPADSRTGHVDHDERGDTSREDTAGGDSDRGRPDTGDTAGDAAGDPGSSETGSTKDTSPEAADEERSGTAKQSGRSKGRGKRGRASVPSWDDVMFGSKRD